MPDFLSAPSDSFIREETIRPVDYDPIQNLEIFNSDKDTYLSSMIEIDTEKPVNVLDITGRVSQAIRESGIQSGLALVYTMHTTCGITVNEADEALIQDMLSLLERLVPQGAGYRHDRGDGNAHAHLRAMLLSSSATIPVEEGALALGTWQRILFLEMDGPRKRRIAVRTIPA